MKRLLLFVLTVLVAMGASAQGYVVDPDTAKIVVETDTTLLHFNGDSTMIDVDSIGPGGVVSVDSVAQGGIVNPDTIYTVHTITQDQFRKLVADYDSVDWVLKSPRPVIVDFYATWCEPCKRLEPVLRQVAQHYNGEIDFYRIDVDANPDIADVFMIRSIPYLLICPLEGEPMNIIGLYSEQEYIRVINQALRK